MGVHVGAAWEFGFCPRVLLTYGGSLHSPGPYGDRGSGPNRPGELESS